VQLGRVASPAADRWHTVIEVLSARAVRALPCRMSVGPRPRLAMASASCSWGDPIDERLASMGLVKAEVTGAWKSLAGNGL
jgi:hypothetical protein